MKDIKDYIEEWLDEKTTLLYERIVIVLDAREQVLDANVFEKPPTYMPPWGVSSNEFLTLVREQIKNTREEMGTQHFRVVPNKEARHIPERVVPNKVVMATPEKVMPEMLTTAYIEAETERQEWLNLASDNEDL